MIIEVEFCLYKDFIKNKGIKKNVEDTLSSQYNVPHFSLLSNFLPSPELDPLEAVQANIRVFAPDSLIDGSSDNLHCIGNFKTNKILIF